MTPIRLLFLPGLLVALLAVSGPPARAQAAAAAPVEAASGAGAAAPRVLPAAEVYFGHPSLQSPKLSATGRWLAVLVHGAGRARNALAIWDVEQAKLHGVAASFADADIADFEWLGDERLVLSIEDRRSRGGDQPASPGLFAVNRDGSAFRQLVQTEFAFGFVAGKASRLQEELLSPNHRLLHVPNGGDEVIVGEIVNLGQGRNLHTSPKRLNTVTGRTTPAVAGGPEPVWRWWFDRSGEARLAQTRSAGKVGLHVREAGGDRWRAVAEFPLDDVPFVAHSLDAKGNVYVTATDPATGLQRLHRLDLATGRPEREPIVKVDGFDFSGGPILAADDGRYLGVRVLADAEATVWSDPALRSLQEAADRRLPRRINTVDCRRCGEAGMVGLVVSRSDLQPGEVWVAKEGGRSWHPVGRERPAVREDQQAATSFERVRTRDGQSMPVWVTRPRGVRGPLPAVVLVHGGPWVRGRSWRWEDMPQFLASRGYVVIEPEFRGSTGYGARWYRAGWKQFGRAMQDDLVDALDWAEREGHAAPRRACVAGASYGGYATLMALARDDGRWRCGVAWAAVTDPRLMFEWRFGTDVLDEHRDHTFPMLIGDPKADAAMLEAVAPVLLAERMKAPLLLAHGTEDRRVPFVHGERMRDALQRAGRAPQWVAYSAEGHGWNLVTNRIDFAGRVEQFLAEHLGGASGSR